MATFGPIASAAPNVLFDAAKLDRDVMAVQRNQLLMQSAQQDQAAQQLERDWTARSSMARQLAALPEDQAAAAWSGERARLQAAGFGHGLPEQFPGMERIRAVASSDLTTFQRMQIEEKRRATEGLMSLLGGGVPAMSGSGADAVSAYPGSAGGSVPAVPASMPTATPAPVGGTGIRADNNDATQRREWAMANLSGPELEAELAAISAGRASALTGQGANTQYRANPGVGGVYAGLPAPAPGVPVLSGGGQAAPRSASGGLAFGPRGLTQDQERILAVTAISNPAGAAAQMAQFQQQNRMLVHQQQQDERQRLLDERRFQLDERRAKREDEKDAREAPSGPIRGNGLNNSLMNILLTGDPASPEYAAAYGRLGAEEVNPATGAVRRPDMSMFRAPTYTPPGANPAPPAPNAAAAPGPGGVEPGTPAAAFGPGGPRSTSATAAVNSALPPQNAGAGLPSAPSAPVNALAPQAMGGRNYGRGEFRPGSETSANDRTKLRQIETEANGILEALETFRTTRKNAGFPERAASAVGLPTELNSSYGNLALLAKGEALYNLGVLNGPDLEIIRRVAADPGTMAGGFATQATVDAQLNQIKGLLEQRLSTARQQFGGAPAGAPAAGGGGASSASGAPRRLRYNPETGKIE